MEPIGVNGMEFKINSTQNYLYIYTCLYVHYQTPSLSDIFFVRHKRYIGGFYLFLLFFGWKRRETELFLVR